MAWFSGKGLKDGDGVYEHRKQSIIILDLTAELLKVRKSWRII